jgi:hypothetical protein
MTPAIAIGLVLQYGPQILTAVENLFKKSTVTAAEVQAIFAGLEPYSAFGIQAPSVPVSGSPTPLPPV